MDGDTDRSNSASRLIRGKRASAMRRSRRRASRSSTSAPRTSARNARWLSRSRAAASASAAGLAADGRQVQDPAGAVDGEHRRLLGQRPALIGAGPDQGVIAGQAPAPAGDQPSAVAPIDPRSPVVPRPSAMRRASMATSAGIDRADPLDRIERGVDGHEGQAAMEQQHLDERPGPGAVAELAACPRPEPLVRGGERARCPRLRQRERRGQRPRLAREDLEIVVEHQRLAAPELAALVAGHDPAVIEDLDRRGRPAAPSTRRPASPAGTEYQRWRTHTRALRSTLARQQRRAGRRARPAAAADGPPGRERLAHGLAPPVHVARPSLGRPPRAGGRAPRGPRPAGPARRWRRRKRPTSPSTPPFSWAPRSPGSQKNESNP